MASNQYQGTPAPVPAPRALFQWLAQARGPGEGPGRPALPIGRTTSVVELTPDLGLAIAVRSVAAKARIARLVGRYEEVGFDCVALPANDVLTVGARPISLVHYLTAPEDDSVLDQIGRGLHEGARQAGITIPGGATSIVPAPPSSPDADGGANRARAFDLVGTCVGLVALDRIITGQDVSPDDLLIGFRSSGLHASGLTLAEQVLFERAGFHAKQLLAHMRVPLGEELLRPTQLYADIVTAMLDRGLPLRALVHVADGGWHGLAAIRSDVGFVIDWLPQPQVIFGEIQNAGKLTDADMYGTFNMGIGLFVVAPPAAADDIADLAAEHSLATFRLGRAVSDPEQKVILRPLGLTLTPDAPAPAG